MIQIGENWYLIHTPPDLYLSPPTAHASMDWVPAIVPGTAAQTLFEAGQWRVEDQFNFDSFDFWYKKQFELSAEQLQSALFLYLDGLATLCEVWLNGQLIFESDNMFLSHKLDISSSAQSKNELYLCFRSLEKVFSQRLPRPRWKTKLVEQQKLRFVRTTLLGRIPGWTPSIAPVGPWKSIYLSKELSPDKVSLSSYLNGDEGVVNFSCEINHPEGVKIEAQLGVGESTIKLEQENTSSGSRLHGVLRIKPVSLWWPHTHGEPFLYPVTLNISSPQHEEKFSLSSIGFKNIHVDKTNDNFSVSVNGEKIFCRGACWTINNIVSLMGDVASLEQTLVLMRDSGTNMIRIGGTMVYEQEAFYQLCDRLGIMVWQDFMFANMDYPTDDKKFNTSIQEEVRTVVKRLRQHVCLSIYCGNSEVEQQAAMLGRAEGDWSNTFFTEQLPQLCGEFHSGVPYLPSTPSSGVFPFFTNQGVTHYYGVGAYMRSSKEVRQHDVKFTPECLAFANIPVTRTRNEVIASKQIPIIHHPRWKNRTPRDTGAGWDFEDVRDHYLKELYGVDPVQLRSFDNERYLALSEVVTGEIMTQVFSEWRSCHGQCSGALVWFLKDLLPGAGWGVIDSQGLPKACYYFLKRCWQSLGLLLTDESLNGLHIHLYNETNNDFQGELEVVLFNELSVIVAKANSDVFIERRSNELLSLDQLLDGFFDTTYSYRFGPAKHSVVVVRLLDTAGEEVSVACYFPNSQLPRLEEKGGVITQMLQLQSGDYQLDLSSDKFLYSVNIDVPGFLPGDNFFNLIPGITKSVLIKARDLQENKPKGYMSAINLYEDVRIKVTS